MSHRIYGPRSPLRSILCNALNATVLLFLIFIFGPELKGQSCTNEPHPGGESSSVDVSIDSPGGAVVQPGSVLPTGTRLRIDSRTTATGSCTGKAWSCPGGQSCQCVETGYVYERTINHTNVRADISTTGGLNGNYSIGTVWGQAYYHELDSRSANSSGPNYLMLSYAGTYTISVQGIITTTPCMLAPDVTTVATITIQAGERTTELGETACSAFMNVTTGNANLQQADLDADQFGNQLGITRTYNSQMQRAGLFGYNWWSNLDVAISAFGTMLLRVDMPDGNGVYLSRPDTSSMFLPAKPLDFRGQVVKNGDNSFTLTLQDGRIYQFNSSGKLLSLTDPNNNTTSFTLDTNGKPITVTDPVGRTLTLTYDSYGLVGSISDSMGTIATYTHAFWGRLTAVTYADGSKFNFTDTFVGNNNYLLTVKDALNNLLRTNTYDSQGRFGYYRDRWEWHAAIHH